MQQITFATGHFLESSLVLLTSMGWLPSIGISAVFFIGFLYWMNLQGKYNRKAAKEGTRA